MKNVFLSLLVVSALIAAGVGGTFADFVDTEISEDNFYQAGISDLLVNGKNDPIGPKLQYTHGAPCKSVDFWIQVFNWGECQGGMLYMHFKDVVSEENGTKLFMGEEFVFDDAAVLGYPPIPDGYRPALPGEPQGPGVWSSEPEKIAEVGDGYVWQIYIPADDPCLLGEDYACGIADHLDVHVEVPLVGATGDEMGNPDTDGDGFVSATEYAEWIAAGNRWETIDTLSGKLVDIDCQKDYLGYLPTQVKSWIHVDLHLQQIECPGWPDPQTRFWPTNALQGDRVTWDMLFELIADP